MMDRFKTYLNIILAALMVWALAAVAGCDDPGKPAAPAPKPAVVSKPIASSPKKKPEKAPVPEKTEAPVVAGNSVSGKKAGKPVQADQSTTPAPVTEDQVRRESAEALKKAPHDLQGTAQVPENASLFQSRETYDFKDRVDPFVPLLSDKPEAPVAEEQEKKPKRILTPLEKMELSQIKLVAIVHSSQGPLAMVEEASGKGYEVRVGTYMGRNGGRVTAITPDGLTVTEYVKDYEGKRRKRTQEVKFHKSEGGE